MHQSILVSIYLDPGLTFDILTDVFENRNMLEESKVLGLLLGIFVMSCHTVLILMQYLQCFRFLVIVYTVPGGNLLTAKVY